MPTTILRLLGFDGPNIFQPRPCVVLQAHATHDWHTRLRNVLKDGAQRIGLVLGYLNVAVSDADDGLVLTATFVTPMPAIGMELARYAVDELNAREAEDAQWDADEPLWALQKRRRAEALPLPALQLIAAAQQRGLPSFVRADGRLQLGYGVRGWSIDLDQLRQANPRVLLPDKPAAAPALPAVPWERLGTIPIIALSGGPPADQAAQLLASKLGAQRGAGLELHADVAAARRLLSDPAVERAIISLDAASIATRGLPCEVCSASGILDLPAQLPPAVADRAEWAQVVGLPLLVTRPDGLALLRSDVPELGALATYAPCPVLSIDNNAPDALLSLLDFL